MTKDELQSLVIGGRLQLRRILALGGLVFGTAVALAIAAVVYASTGPEAYDPLGDYPDQHLVDDDQVVGFRDDVVVQATKCVDADVPVDVQGQTRWRRTDPPGLIITAFAGTNRLDPGCTDFEYHNGVPPDVIADVLENGPSRWTIVGTETPFQIDDRVPISRSYQLDTDFLVVPTTPE